MGEREKRLLLPLLYGWPTRTYLVSFPLLLVVKYFTRRYLSIKESMRMLLAVLGIQQGKEIALANPSKRKNLLVKQPSLESRFLEQPYVLYFSDFALFPCLRGASGC